MTDIQRCDIRVPQNLYNEIAEIAEKEFNAPRYHKTGKVQVSSTIIELIKLGIATLRGEVNLSDTSTDINQIVNQVVEEKFQSIKQLPDNISTNPSLSKDDINLIVSKAVSSQIKSIRQLSDTLPDKLTTREEMNQAISQFATEAISTEIASLRNELQPILDAHQETEELLSKIKCLVSTLETEQQIEENLPTQIDFASLDPIFDDEEKEEDVDWNQLKVSELRKVITIKELGQKFREKLGKAPRDARKAEIVKFLQSTYIFD